MNLLEFDTTTNTYFCIYGITMDNFFKLNPPCGECLVQNMCLEKDYTTTPPRIRAKQCDILKQFLKKIHEMQFNTTIIIEKHYEITEIEAFIFQNQKEIYAIKRQNLTMTQMKKMLKNEFEMLNEMSKGTYSY